LFPRGTWLVYLGGSRRKREKLIYGKRNVLDPRGPKEVIKVLDRKFKGHFSFCDGRVRPIATAVEMCSQVPRAYSSIVSQLGEVADLEAQMFNLAQMFIRKPNVQFSTEPAILPNCC